MVIYFFSDGLLTLFIQTFFQDDEKKDKTKKNHEVAKPNEKSKSVVDEHFVNMAVKALEKKVDTNTKYLKSFEALVCTHLFRTALKAIFGKAKFLEMSLTGSFHKSSLSTHFMPMVSFDTPR